MFHFPNPDELPFFISWAPLTDEQKHRFYQLFSTYFLLLAMFCRKLKTEGVIGIFVVLQ